jgi:lysophospholipase L1-like esterase
VAPRQHAHRGGAGETLRPAPETRACPQSCVRGGVLAISFPFTLDFTLHSAGLGVTPGLRPGAPTPDPPSMPPAVLSLLLAMPVVALAETTEALAAERAKVQADFPAEFAPVADDPALPRVLLIGDSISIGYTLPVRELLRGVANLHRVPENGGPSSRGLQQLAWWLGRGRWDVIHFNFGLHDIKLDAAGRPLTAPEDYERNLRAIATALRATGARLVFATTTPVPADLASGPRRRNADVLARNEIARRVMDELGVPVNDLYAAAAPRLAELQRPANVHFTADGSRALAEPVAAAIRRELASRPPPPSSP